MNPSLNSEPSFPRRIAVLGSTGSIGLSALDVISRLPERLEIFALSAGSNVERIAEQTLTHNPRVVALANAEAVEPFREAVAGRWSGEILEGPSGIEQAAGLSEVDLVLNGVVGAAGLRPSWRAIREGKTLALANKESLVIAGAFLTREAREHGATLLPVDSEHNGLFQLIDGANTNGISRLILTASGGPFRTRELSSFDRISPEEALRHPTWKMGARITIDSATLLNKGFEVLEARWLFDIEAERIEVWIHPQSIIHGLVEWKDGSTTAQLSMPDMRVPIQHALCYPDRTDSGLPSCDLTRIGRLDFDRPDPDRYPCLGLARRALEEGTTAPAVLNAADEVLVQGFLEGAIPFLKIADLLERVLDVRPHSRDDDLDAVLEADSWARREAASVLAQCP